MLINPKRYKTIESVLEHVFIRPENPSDECAIQIGRYRFKYARVNPVDYFSILYRQLWLFAFREKIGMEKETKKRLAGPRMV